MIGRGIATGVSCDLVCGGHGRGDRGRRSARWLQRGGISHAVCAAIEFER